MIRIRQPQPAPKFLCEREVSARYSISPRTLQHWRLMRRGPRWYRLSTGLVRYKVTDIEAWLATRAVEPIGVRFSQGIRSVTESGEVAGPERRKGWDG